MSKRRRLYGLPPVLEWLEIPLFGLVFLVTLPVTLPVALILHQREEDQRKRQAEQATCVRCGFRLGAASLRRADVAWAASVNRLHEEHPGCRFRLVRRVWAICAECGQEYDYDEKARQFTPREPERAVAEVGSQGDAESGGEGGVR